MNPAESNAPSRAASPLLLGACALALVAVLAGEWDRWKQEGVAPIPAKLAEGQGNPDRQVTLDQVSTALIPMPPGVPSAHASALAPLPGNRMLAFWWAGSRESGPDVKVYSARWAAGAWGPAREVAGRDSLGAALGYGVRRIGNPVAWASRDGTVHLYVVITGLGGWAASRVVQLESRDDGASFALTRILPMSPLFNTSVLVRSAPVELADGGWWLPAYFEMGIKYPLVMSFDKDGAPRWLTRIGNRTSTLQPSLAAVSPFEAHAWMRDASAERRVQQAVSHDGGASWEDLPALDLANNSSSVAAYRLTQGGYLLLHNHVDPGQTARNVLRLSRSSDAKTWETIFDVASGKPEEEFSYPTLHQVGNELHVSYTSQRTAIAHHVYRIGYKESAQ